MSELLPCPFCGGRDFDWMLDAGMHVMCNDCGATGPNGDSASKDDGTAAWNRRAAPAEVEALRAQLAAAREALERIVGGDHPEGTSLAVNNNYRELEARLRAIARAALAALEDRT